MSQCPKNDSLFQERSRRKNCKTLPQCTGEPLVYHCVRFREELVEVCAPRGLITGKHHQTNLILSLFPFCFDTYYTHVIVYVHPKYMFRKKRTPYLFSFKHIQHACIVLNLNISFVMVNINSIYLICVRNRLFFTTKI